MKSRRLIICRVGRPATTPAGGDVYGLVDVELGWARHTELLADPGTRTG
ncbi:hypothetical protein [Micromonospora sp. S4605]|nr:hypothetical protein [Micromonospora sp. S4605]